MRSWTIRKATRRLRGSFSPSITWMKPKVKSAPRPFSSGKERTRSLLFHEIGSLGFLQVCAVPLLPLPLLSCLSEQILFVFLVQKKYLARCVMMHTLLQRQEFKIVPQTNSTLPSFHQGESGSLVSLYHSLEISALPYKP